MSYLVLTAEQADAVRTEWLQPILMTDGRFILPVAVLADPRHADQFETLAALPQIDESEVLALLEWEEP